MFGMIIIRFKANFVTVLIEISSKTTFTIAHSQNGPYLFIGVEDVTDGML